MNYVYFLAPAWFEPDNFFRMVGFSSTADTNSIPGCRFLWPAGLPIQEDNPTTPAEWTRFTVAVIPDGQFAADGIYAHVCATNDIDLTQVTPKSVVYVADDATSPAEWDRMVLAIIDPAFWASYGNSYVSPGNGMYYDEDYRATVCVPQGRENLVPATWVSITQEDAAARHPNAGV